MDWLLLMEIAASGMFTLALQMYVPPWLIRRGEKVLTLMKEDSRDAVTPSILPSGLIHIMTRGSVSACCRVTVQVRLSMSPTVELPVAATSTIGSAGAARRQTKREVREEGESG